MRKWCDRLQSAAPMMGIPRQILGLLFCTALACGPRTVPYPDRRGTNPPPAAQPRPTAAGTQAYPGQAAGAGQIAAPTGTAGISIPSNPVAAEGGIAALPMAGLGGSVIVPPPPAAGRGASASLPFDAGSDPARNNVRPGGICSRLAVIQCAAETHCCVAPTRTRTECETAARSACSDSLYLDTIAQNPITGFDPVFAGQVFTELEARSSQCDLSIATWSLSPQGLRGILKGTLEPNASCKPPPASLMDKPSQAAALASCKSIDTNACLPKSLLGDWTCAGKSGVGANCITDDNCQADLYCRNPNMAPLGKCTARAQLGGSCSNGGECVSLFCKNGSCVPPDTQLAFCGN